MTHLDTELHALKSDIIEMWALVMDQLKKTYQAIENSDCDLVDDIHANEKRVDAFELKRMNNKIAALINGFILTLPVIKSIDLLPININ